MSNAKRPLIVVPSDDPAQCQGSPRMAELEAVAQQRQRRARVGAGAVKLGGCPEVVQVSLREG